MCVSDLGSADEPQEYASTFSDNIPDNILSGMDAVSDAVSKRADSTVLPSGAASVIGAVVDGNTSEPQTAAVTGNVNYDSTQTVEELRLAGGANVTIGNDVTLTANTLYIESAGTAVSFSTGDNGKMVIGTLVIEGLIIPMANVTVQADNASVVSEYQHDGQVRSLSLTVSYTGDLMIGIGGYTVTYTSVNPAEIGISAEADLTGYTSHIAAPGALSTFDKLIKYIGALDLIKLDIGISVGGTYGIADYPVPFRISDMELTINSHKNADPAYYSVELSIGNNRTYPVDITSMSILMELPASRMSDGSRPSMDRSRQFSLTADTIEVERVEPDDPLSVTVDGLSIGMFSEPDPKLTMSMTEMAYRETVMDDTGTHDVSTTVSDFDLDFKGTSSDLLDNAKEMILKLISGDTIEGDLALGGIDYRSYEADGITSAEHAAISDINVKASLTIPRLGVHADIGSFVYKDGTRDLSSGGLAYDIWIGINPSFDPGSATKITDILKLLEIRSVATITADGDGNYSFTVDGFRHFITRFTTDGLRAVCGSDTLTFDKQSIAGFPSDSNVQFSYHRLTADEIKDRVPGSVRSRLNGGEVVELTNSLGRDKLDATVEISVETGLDPEKAGAYYINTDRDKLEERESSAADGHVTFTTDTMGLHAVSGPLKEPDRTVLAWGLVTGAAVLGIVTVLVGRRLIAKGA